jgi:deoxyadenosine/deoxycytidine kinase
MPTIISVEGNIGSGKSTLVSEMKKVLPSLLNNKIFFLQEPVDEWEKIRDTNGESIITKFYRDQNKYAFSFQMMAYISRLKTLMETIDKIPSNAVIICERSVWTDKHIFAKMLYEDGNIEEINYIIYNKWFDFFIKGSSLDGIIYLNTDPNTCLERVLKRKRDGEKIPLEYLEKCHNYHLDWFKIANQSMLSLDDKQKNTYKLTDDWSDKIITFIKELQLKKPHKPLDVNELLRKSCC